MLEGGFFYKQITRPIYAQQAVLPAAGDTLSQAFGGDLVLQEVNGDHAYVSGVELAYQQHLRFLPGFLGNARINTNFTYTASTNYNITGRTDNPALVGQAPLSWDITPAYATRRALITFGASHNGASIYPYQYQSEGPWGRLLRRERPQRRQLLLCSHADRCTRLLLSWEGRNGSCLRTEYEQRGLRVL